MYLQAFANKMDTKLLKLSIFCAETLSSLTRSKLTEIIYCLLSQAGMYPSNYASHSFRIWAATHIHQHSHNVQVHPVRTVVEH